MMKFIKKIVFSLLSLLLLSGSALAAEPEKFTITENFDDASHFTVSQSVPDGWKSTGTYAYGRYLAGIYEVGFPAESGDYVMYSGDSTLPSRDEVLYTPMMNLVAGKECTISFSFMAPGGSPTTVKHLGLKIKAGSAQTPEAQTIEVGTVESKIYTEWTDFMFSFTPEADGEYCFSIALDSSANELTMKGYTGLDSFEITGYTKPSTPPAEETVTQFEVIENFDDASHFTISQSVPDGWKSTGTYAYGRYLAGIYEVGFPAESGDYVMYSGDSTLPSRDEVLYTPMMNLVAGKECTISFSFMAPGGSPTTVKHLGLKIKAGSAQTPEAQTIEVGTVESKIYTEWTDFMFSFTPEADGEYCFSIALDSSANELTMKGYTGLDSFVITGYTKEGGETPVDPVLPPVEIETDPFYIYLSPAFIGESYTSTINVKAANLRGDITVENISTTEIVPAVLTIPMAEASSEDGYNLVVTSTPASVESYGGSFELKSEGLEEPIFFNLMWSPVETTEVSSLAGLTACNPEDYMTYKYTGEAIVTYVDQVYGKVYMQDATAGVRVSADNISNVKIGDKISNQYVNLLQEDDGLTFISATDALNVVASDNIVTAQEVTLKELARNAGKYVNELVRVREVTVDASTSTFSDATVAVTDGSAGSLKPFEETDLIGTEIPGEVVNIYGIVTSSTAAVISPRSLDDIEELVDLTPDSSNYNAALELPYYNTFDNYEGDYSGMSVVPNGWLTVGSNPFCTANTSDLSAVTGTYYLVAPESDIDYRDDRLYTPFFRLKADTEYIISYYLYMPGNNGGGVLRDTDLRVTVGTDQDFDFHPTTVQLIEDQSIAEWTKQEFTFTPKKSGAYCFAFSAVTYVNYSGMVAIDDFNITAPGLVAKPEPNFAVGGVFDVFDSHMNVYPNQTVSITNLSRNADEYAWEVTTPQGSVLTSEEESPEFTFDETGRYSIKLSATNSAYTLSTTKSIDVNYINEAKEFYTMMTWNPNHDALLERGSIPAFVEEGNEDSEYDFVTGFNRYYNKFAERFDVPANVSIEISTLNTWLANYRNRAYTSGYDSEKPFDIVVYGETDGQLDETKELARLSSTLKDVFGNTGIGGNAGEPRAVDFESLMGAPLKVNGPFYFALEFAPDMTITTDDPNVGRSYIAFNATRHSTNISTLYVKPNAVPEYATAKADGKWYPVDMVDNTMKGIGAYFILWVNTKPGVNDVAINTLGETVFAIRLNGDNLLVSGTKQGEQVLVYNVNGMVVANAAGQEGSTSINVGNLLNGTYIVKTESGVAKFVK